MGPVKIFICHSSADKPFVRRLKKELESFLHTIWVDEDEIRVGDMLSTSIQKAVTEAGFVLLVVSSDLKMSSWVKMELETTIMHEKEKNQLKLLPCLIDHIKLPEVVDGRKYADFRESFEIGLRQLLEVVSPEEKGNTLDVYVNKSVVTLDIATVDGSLVHYQKTCVHNCLINRLETFVDFLGSEGRVDNMSLKGGEMLESWPESGMQYFKFRYDKPLNKGDKAGIQLNADFHDGFMAPKEYWATLTNNHNTDSFRVIVKFPVERPPFDWWLDEKSGTKYQNKGQTGIRKYHEGNRSVLEQVVEHPVNFVNYLLRWKW